MKKRFVHFAYGIVVVALVSNSIDAQWVQTGGPAGGIVSALAVNDDNVFAGTFRNGVFRSTNNGVTWVAVNSGFSGKNISSLVVRGNRLFAGT